MGSEMMEAVHPIVLVHGLLGFATFGGRLEYFRGVMSHLENDPSILGGRAKVYVADLDPMDTIPSRAIQLRDFIQNKVLRKHRQMRFRKVNIFAHSMGGLDARYMVSQLSMDVAPHLTMADCVASITTIGTPHRGTPVADWLVDHPIIRRFLTLSSTFSVDLSAFRQLTERFLVEEDFDARMPDQEGVRYFSYAGDVPSKKVAPVFYLFAPLLHRRGSMHDGVVPTESARYRYPGLLDDTSQILPADHAAQVGYALPGRRFRHLNFYARLANALGDQGLYFQSI